MNWDVERDHRHMDPGARDFEAFDRFHDAALAPIGIANSIW